MPRPPAEGVRQEPVDGPHGVLSTKLYLPGPQPGYVLRPRLIDLLSEGLTHALTLVCAPAGFGKTALVADWARTRRPLVAWLSLDAGDNDPTRFWRHVAAALDRAHPGIAKVVGPMLGPPAPSSFDPLVAALINELSQSGEEEVLIVLDDYHEIESRTVNSSVTYLLEHLPARVHLILTSRADPPLPLARLRGRGQLTELRAADLRFNGEEAAALLREAVGPDQSLPDAAIGALAARTEGWATGLQLAALTLRGRSDVDAFVASFSGSHRFVLDYLAEEVLERQSADIRAFLLETSVLERLTGSLCNAVTGRAGGQAMLETIERANLFLVPLDEVRGWWRYHHLFADLLRARLRQEAPSSVRELHRRAATWHEEHGLVDDAVRHALAARDPEWAARLIEINADALFLSSQEATLRRWVAGLPIELTESHPRLLLASALLALLAGDLEAVEAPLEAAERVLNSDDHEVFEPSVGRAVSLLANVPATIALARANRAQFQGDATAALTFGHRALAEIGEGEDMLRSITRLGLGVAKWLQGQLDEAERQLGELIDGLLTAGQPTVAAWASYSLGQVQSARGDLDAAHETYRRALEFRTASGAPALPAVGIGRVGLAEIAYKRDDLDAASRDAIEGVSLCRQIADTKPLARGLATLALVRQAQGDSIGAREAMAEALDVAPGPEVVDLLNPVGALWARLRLVQGDLPAAAQWTVEREFSVDEPASYPREGEYLAYARVLAAQGLAEQSLPILDGLLAAASAQSRTSSVIEIQTVRSIALATAGDHPRALTALSEALTLASPQGWVRVFIDEGMLMAALIAEVVAGQRGQRGAAGSPPLEYLGRLMRAIESEATPNGSGGPRVATLIPGLVESLSARELEVLRLVAAGKPNREIADELFVALDTVKKHVTHIFEKLGAVNRTEATARARELGLLP